MTDKLLPQKPGYYWAKWRIATDATHEGDDLTPSNTWEIVQVNANVHGCENEADYPERLSVSVPGVREVQWRDGFVWGDFVAPLENPPSQTNLVVSEIALDRAVDAFTSSFDMRMARNECLRNALSAALEVILPSNPSPQTRATGPDNQKQPDKNKKER